MKPLCQARQGGFCAARKGAVYGAFEKAAGEPAGVTTDQFLTVFTVVIAFYFGTQAEKRSAEKAEATANSGTDQAGGEAA